MGWKEALGEGEEIVLATSSNDGKPRAIVVVSLGFVDGKLLIGACQMRSSLKNIAENRQVSIVARSGKGCYRIDGNAEVFSSGSYFESAFGKSDPPKPYRAILISIDEVFDLDSQNKIV
ncbi:MAG: pyridoxamine 5'-phosphate oxidase family protein [Nanoarchaeota archaeon]